MADLIRRYVRPDDLVRATFSGVQRNATSPWQRVVIRRIVLSDAPHTQFNWHTAQNCVTRNYGPEDALPIEELASVSFRHAHVEAPDRTIEARVAKRGQLLVTARNASNEAEVSHDEPKHRLITEDAPFLELIGMSQNGRVKPTAQRKYRQINEFIRTVDHTLGTAARPGVRLRIVDLGCGNAYLTFAMHHFLTEVRGADCIITGVDRGSDTIQRNNARATQLRVPDRLTFVESEITDFTPEEPPDLVVALHACDTASDDALAKGVHWDAPFLLVSPCCHHNLQQQLPSSTLPPGFGQIMRHGVLREQFGDLLTDTLRACLLTVAGYAVEVFAFVPLEHTARNNLIRAVRRADVRSGPALADYRALTENLRLKPRLAELLDTRLPEISAGNRRL
jgi:trans-aconitate methyltransferase